MDLEQAAVVPIVIGITQVLKPFKRYFKYHDLAALIIALFGTLGVILFNMSEETFMSLTKLGMIKLTVESVFTAFATWLSAGKLYDMSIGKW